MGTYISNESYELLIKNVRDYAILMLDPSGIVVSWNAGASRLLGYKEQEILGTNFSIFFTTEDRADNKPERQLAAAEKKGSAEDSNWIVRKDGTCFWASGTTTPLWNENKEIRGFAKIFRDKTEVKRYEDELLRTEERFRALIENSSDVIATLDDQANITFMGASIKKLLGYSSKEVEKTNGFKYIKPDDLEETKAAFQRLLKNPDQTQTIETRIRHKNGNYIWMEITGSNLIGNGNIGAIIINFRDITERKNLEHRKDEFISIASHELKTPVATIKGFSQIIDRYLQNSPDELLISYATKMGSQIDRLVELLNGLLDVSQIQSGNLALGLQSFSLQELVEDIASDMRRINDQYRIEVSGKIKGKVTADKFRIEQVIINLLTNAIKYSPKSKKITINLSKEKKVARVSVKDSGIGIAKKDLQKIFERFFRADTRIRESFSGLGLGLYISNAIIKRHGGELSVTSKKSHGSTFTFTLPTNSYTIAADVGK